MIPPPKNETNLKHRKDCETLAWSSKILYKSFDNAYDMDPDKPHTGDLMMSTIGEINYPAVYCSYCSKSFLVIGAVVGLKKM